MSWPDEQGGGTIVSAAKIDRGRPHPQQIGGRHLFNGQALGRLVERLRRGGLGLPGVKVDVP